MRGSTVQYNTYVAPNKGHFGTISCVHCIYYIERLSVNSLNVSRKLLRV